MALICGGASLMNRRQRSGGPDPRLDGYLDFTWHGAHDGGAGPHRDVYENLSVVRHVRGGQFDLMFCSTKCLRAFLNMLVDDLEHRIRRESGKQRSSK